MPGPAERLNKAPLAPVEIATPTASERFSIRYIKSQFDQAWKELAEFQADVIKTHPGFHFNPNTSQIEKDAPSPPPLVDVEAEDKDE